MVTNAPDAPVFPPGRYGRRRSPRRGRRWLSVILAVLLAAGMAALVWKLYGRYGNPAYQTTTPTMDQVSDRSVTVDFTVRKRAAGPAVCRVQARDHSGAEVGYAAVPVGAGTTVAVRYTLTTTGKAYAVDVLGCGIQ